MEQGMGAVYFVGIGGISMSALAEITAEAGIPTAGCDRADTEITRRLRARGIPVESEAEAKAGRLLQASLAVYTAAIPKEHPARRAAERAGIPCIPRAAYLGRLMEGYVHRIGVAGMHGKSTVTSMLAEIFLQADTNPTVVSGAALPALGGAYRIGGKQYFLFEACEYRDSFLHFSPTTAVLLNLELDHVDYFHSLSQIQSSFLTYASKAERAIYFADDPCLCDAMVPYLGEKVTYSLSGKGDYTAEGVMLAPRGASFTVRRQGTLLGEITLQVPGAYNVQNALAATAVADAYGIAFSPIRAALAQFQGAKRRMEYLFDWRGAAVYTDYAHHPTEITAVLTAARAMTKGKVVCVFQPHTYSRTAKLFPAFATALRGADQVYIAPTYGAREQNTFGVDEESLAHAVGKGTGVLASEAAFLSTLEGVVEAGDLVLLLGAGDLWDGRERRLFGKEPPA